MRHYSWLIQQTMGDQQLGDNLERNCEDGVSISVQRPWVRDDEDEWPEVAVWVKEQQDRLAAVLQGRAERASQERFRAVLQKVPTTPAGADDLA